MIISQAWVDYQHNTIRLQVPGTLGYTCIVHSLAKYPHQVPPTKYPDTAQSTLARALVPTHLYIRYSSKYYITPPDRSDAYCPRQLYEFVNMAHPALSSSDSDLSSAPSDASLFRDVGEMLVKYSPEHEGDKTRLVLQSFLDELPQQGSNNIREDIHGCNSDQQLRDLAHHLIFNILTPLKAKSCTPSVGPSPSAGWAESVESVASDITLSERQQKWLRKTCLERDGNRCVISGSYDFSQWKKLPVSDPIRNEPEQPYSTQAAHILPFSCGSFDAAGTRKASATWDAIWRAFPSMRFLNFGPDQINNPYNALTLVSGLHVAFGSFSIALESTGTPGTYRICKFGDLPGEASSMLPKSGTVTLTGTDQIPAPHPVLLQAHAAVARILHLTAMAEMKP